MNSNTKIVNFPNGKNEIINVNGTNSSSDYDTGGQYYFNNFSTLINKIGSSNSEELVLIDTQNSCSSSSTSRSSSMSPLSGIFSNSAQIEFFRF